ncbi:MAG: hypothetical protein AB8E82_13810 [Aureispira sp.]
MRKKKPVKDKETLLKEYEALKKQKNSWWNVLLSENNSVKTILGGFVLYLGYYIVKTLNINALLLIYTIVVVGVVWYWIDMLRTQYEHNNKIYKEKMRVLSGEIRRWAKKKIVTETILALPEKRSLHAAQSLLPHLWGAVPEAIEQLDEYVLSVPEQPIIQIASLYWRQERQFNAYWLLGATLPVSSIQGDTALLPLPYQLPQWERVHFNEAIELPTFKEQYSISTTAFMHSYYTLSRTLVEQFLALPSAASWLMIRQNKVYLAIPKPLVEVSIKDLDGAQITLENEGQEALALGLQFSSLLQNLTYPVQPIA